MTFFKCFEEFTQDTGMPFIEKLRLYALASDVPTKVSEIKKESSEAYFVIDTKLPGDYEDNSVKTYRVIVPFDRSKPTVETFENGKQVMSAQLESEKDGRDVEQSVFFNYVEATQLFNDPVIEDLADNYKTTNSVEDIKKVIKNLQ